MAKQKTNLKTMNAKAALYGNRVTPGSAFRVIMVYEVGAIAFAGLMYGPTNFLAIAIIAIVCAIFVYKRVLPYKIDDNYRIRGEDERSQFMHLVTQGMSAQNASMLPVMKRATKAASGEFYDDMVHLLIKLEKSRNYDICDAAFHKVVDKYRDDLYFVMFMEQCETTFLEDQYNIDTFRSFQESHDTMMAKEKYFSQRKAKNQVSLVMLLAIVWGVTAIVMLSQGYQTYQKVWLTLPGIVISTIFFILMARILRSFYKLFYDNNVTQL